ncbi:aminotransferase class V-fold PLP-dependent enzyme [Allocatelliglobosispora scoriae]|uniref:aminotransferase class V-fold PLP-dependent enzyme n=1 Tax=Allocatelliglobosispora scoriae TaxID=643052 RepID=UPI0028AB7C41|nr:aminotransferase class V-fold PLP-dependent enzyme [Allocatelliglobosispora scoriae]
MERWTPPQLWRHAEPGWLNTASYGLPPDPAWDAMRAAQDDWRAGRTSWEAWGSATDRARESFARLIGVDAADVAVGAQVTQLLAPVAAAMPDGASVLVPSIEFTSNVFPWAVHADRGVTVHTAPTTNFLAAISPGIDVVAFSLVQSADGTLADLRAISEAAREVGAMVVVDATQACGWLPFDGSLADMVVVGAYKWLMAPRGTGFAYLAPHVRDRFRPIMAGWYAGDDPHGAYYGLPLRLAKDARAFDLSPAWGAWAGTEPALAVIEQIGVERIHAHNLALANRFLAGLGREPGSSAIVTVDVPGAEQRLAAAGIRAAVRAGRVRASFHIYTTESDVDAAVEALVD